MRTITSILSKTLQKFTGTSSKTPLQKRRAVAEDTISRSEVIIRDHATEGASHDSVFFNMDELSPLDASSSPNLPTPEIKIVNLDSFTLARGIMRQDVDAIRKTAVLNLASDELPAGGWLTSLTKTQEEALCYSSTLYVTLKPEYYPWPNTGTGSRAGVFSPGVVIFKDDLDHECVDLPPEDRRVVSVITVAAPRCPSLTEDRTAFKDPSVLEDLRGKIRHIYRMAAHHGQQYLVLGAFGCGAYKCPPVLVAEEMKAILMDDEFRGWFRQIVFAIYSSGEVGRRNFDVFSKVFEVGPSLNSLNES
ncbi:hypothetical protein E4T56_gene4763 [Termitomyces sp. T112]|nr:hypothetical protein E4T56_gene4763 [Termitomyces sp. T112]